MFALHFAFLVRPLRVAIWIIIAAVSSAPYVRVVDVPVLPMVSARRIAVVIDLPFQPVSVVPLLLRVPLGNGLRRNAIIVIVIVMGSSITVRVRHFFFFFP